MHLRSIALKGFKSFPDRIKLEFTPGVSVIVGPNGSGKSNITDAVLWALGEQSPLAVRGQSMQDVIFAGGHGVPSRNAAEVEVVIDNPHGVLDGQFSELSIVRRLDRSGDGEYRLNGARCRLVDVLEVLSDTGLGKEMHSVVSQGRVEAIIHSKPRDRRLLIEEAAGLGKHRKRRRRAQLKLERTQDNIARVLDVEREARSRLRPLKRQAEAAELHERLERQSLEARLEVARDAAGSAGRELTEAEAGATAARERLEQAERLLAGVAERRERAEEEFAAHSRRREALSGRLFAARSAEERIAMRLERAGEVAERSADAAVRLTRERDALAAEERDAPEGTPALDRVAALDEELARVDAELAGAAEREVAGLVGERDSAAARREELESALASRRGELDSAEQAAEAARSARVEADRQVEAARRRAAEAGAELAAVNQFLARASSAVAGEAHALAEELQVEPGYEAAVAAVLGPLLRASVVNSINEGTTVLDALGADGGSAIVAAEGQRPGGGAIGPHPGRFDPPVPEARPMIDLIQPAPRVAAAAERLLADAWLVPSLDALAADFTGIAATSAGRVYVGTTGELRQAPEGGESRLLEERARRDRLVTESQDAVQAEAAALAAAENAERAVTTAYEDRDRAEGALRAAVRERDEAAEAVHRTDWLIERRREAPAEGPAAVRRAELAAELRAERRLAEQVELARAERRRRIAALGERAQAEAETARHAERVVAALRSAAESVALRREAAARDLAARDEHGESTAAELRTCAREEAELQRKLREAGEHVTGAEVRAQQARDVAAERGGELRAVATALGHAEDSEHAAPLADALEAERRDELEARVERLARRREQLGPVNPLAKQEYDEAVEHVEELETQRSDLEAALAELEGLIRETDKRIRESFEETFEAAARNFEDVVSHLFPGGSGRLRLVQPEQAPRPVLGGEEEPRAEAGEGDAEAESEAAAEAEIAPAPEDPGVEIEVTPAGKSTKRLSLMSGGEKSLVALAFLFAVFLARPCPFYILDEVEAALDDANIDRFLQLVRRFSDRAQFIVVTHQKRTMDAADCLYGVSMGGDGVSKVISRKLPREESDEDRQRRFEPAADAAATDAEVRAA
jgi:chromosome segregation protein